MKVKYLILTGFVAILFACNDNEAPQPNTNSDDNKDTVVVYKQDLLLQKWKIVKATHDGNHDASSTGKFVKFIDQTNYNFDNSFNGKYRWSADSTILYLDEATQYSQDWQITTLTEDEFNVDFNSPFTGKPSRWEMEPTF